MLFAESTVQVVSVLARLTTVGVLVINFAFFYSPLHTYVLVNIVVVTIDTSHTL